MLAAGTGSASVAARTTVVGRGAGAPRSVAQSVTLPMLADPGSLNPLYARDVYAREVALLTEPTLLRANPAGGWQPYLAESVSTVQGGREWVFRLNPRARWSNGRRITSADVVATFEAAARPANRTAYAALFAGLSSVVASGPETVDATFEHAIPDGLERVGLVPILPASVVRPRMGNRRALASWNPITIRRALTGGPYRVTGGNLLSGRLSFARRFGFWLVVSLPNHVTLQYEATTADAWNAFLAGSLSATDVPKSRLRAAIHLAGQGRIALHTGSADEYTFLGFNLRNPVLASLVVREAIRLAVPAAQIARGLGEVPTPFGPSPWAPGSVLDGSRNLVPAEHVRTAQALLASAGWKAAFKGATLTRDGSPLRFTCVTVTGVPGWDEAVNQIAQALAKVGIDMNITYLPFRTLTQFLASPAGLSPTLGAYALAFVPEPGDGAASLYGGAAAFPPAGSDAGGYQNQVVTRLLFDGEGTLSAARRHRLTTQLIHALAVDPPALFLGAVRTTVAMAPKAAPWLRGPSAALAKWWSGEGDLG